VCAADSKVLGSAVDSVLSVGGVCCRQQGVSISGLQLCELESEYIIVIIIILSVSTLFHVLYCQGQSVPKAKVTNKLSIHDCQMTHTATFADLVGVPH